MNTNEKKSPLEWGELACEALMNTFDASNLPPKGRFHYHQGVFLLGMEQCYLQNADAKYDEYIKAWLNSIIDANGQLSECDPTQFDDIQPSILLYRLLDDKHNPQYRKVLDTLIPPFKDWKVNEKGGFWHKDDCQNQVWLDSLFMSGPVAMRYGQLIGDDSYYTLIAHQAKLMYTYMRDEASGLLYHAWDPSKVAPWADAQTGCSPEIWGRALGWVPVALVEILDILPTSHPDYNELKHILQDILKSLIPFQDSSGLWYQVIDKGDDKNNWLETSCTSLFVYALAKAVRLGLLHKVYLTYALQGYHGIINRLNFDDNNKLLLEHVCIGTGVGDYTHYLHRPTSTNDLHGIGTFAMMCAEINLSNPSVADSAQ